MDDPKRYVAASGQQAIDVMRDFMTPEEFRGFCKGNVIKYTLREARKGGDADLQKAARYIAFAIAENIEKETNE